MLRARCPCWLMRVPSRVRVCVCQCPIESYQRDRTHCNMLRTPATLGRLTLLLSLSIIVARAVESYLAACGSVEEQSLPTSFGSGATSVLAQARANS